MNWDLSFASLKDMRESDGFKHNYTKYEEFHKEGHASMIYDSITMLNMKDMLMKKVEESESGYEISKAYKETLEYMVKELK